MQNRRYQGGTIIGGCVMCGNCAECEYDGGVLMGGNVKGTVSLRAIKNALYKKGGKEYSLQEIQDLVNQDPSPTELFKLLNDRNTKKASAIREKLLSIIDSGLIGQRNKNDLSKNYLYNTDTYPQLGTGKRKYPCTKRKLNSYKTDRGRGTFRNKCPNYNYEQ